jgi:hypothetical protein
MSQVRLSTTQKNILKKFYDKSNCKISLNKVERNKIWNDFKENRNIEKFSYLSENVPAFYAELNKALLSKRKIQSAVFSECVYAQALANQFSLSIFENHINEESIKFISPGNNMSQLDKFSIRYSYSNISSTIKLIQAGGAGAVDCALISDDGDDFTRIEMKEPYARTSEPDLPKYSEDGYLVTSDEFRVKYPQFNSMMEEQLAKNLNVFEHLGSNVSEFSSESIEKAVAENYLGTKFADVICTEDELGNLVMIPSDHVGMWAKLEGEIRPSGRNAYRVWTPKKLIDSLDKAGATTQKNKVTLPASSMKEAKERGGKNISRLKINPLFFIRSKDVMTEGLYVSFDLSSIKQLAPSITAKMKFENLDVEKVKKFYLESI